MDQNPNNIITNTENVQINTVDQAPVQAMDQKESQAPVQITGQKSEQDSVQALDQKLKQDPVQRRIDRKLEQALAIEKRIERRIEQAQEEEQKQLELHGTPRIRLFKRVTGILSMVFLLASFVAGYIMVGDFMSQDGLEENDEILNAAPKRVGEIHKLTGSLRTIKSNSLDGIPLMQDPGSSLQVNLIPEGKACQVICGTRVDDVSWIKVDYCGLEGWVKSDMVHALSEEDVFIREGTTVFINRITELGLKAYEEPNMASREVAEGLCYGREFEVEELVDGWGKVLIDGEPAYINMYHVGSYPVDIWKVETLSSAREINFRSGPDSSSTSLCKIPEGTRLTMLEYEDGWGYTEYQGMRGWVMLHYLTPVRESS